MALPASPGDWLTPGAGWGGVAVGLVGGIVSGLLGVSRGGSLVPGLALVLGLDQRRAQAVSLVAQLLPTGLPGVLEYHRKGHRLDASSILFAALGFLAGAYAGARLAGGVPERALQWLFAGYLVTLATLMIVSARALADRDQPGPGPWGHCPDGPWRWSARAAGSPPASSGSAAGSRWPR